MYEFSISTNANPSVDIRSPYDIVPLDDSERVLMDDALSALRKRGAPETDSVERRLRDLENLGAAVSRFPSVRETQRLGTVAWGPETLEAALCSMSGTARLLRTPTRVVAGRSFLVAKVHALSFVAMSVSFDQALGLRLRNAILGVVFSLLAEDVYRSCLEDRDYPPDRKAALAADLVHLWDDRRDPRALSHVPALTELWSVRDSQIPVYGTMEGAFELTRLSLDLGPRWFAFMSERLCDEETLFALEEFLFGLSFEEIARVRERLAKRGLCSADSNEVRAFLDGKSAYAPVDGSDPRAMYEFYAERRESARARAWAGIPGPRKTLEESYLLYLLSQEE